MKDGIYRMVGFSTDTTDSTIEMEDILNGGVEQVKAATIDKDELNSRLGDVFIRKVDDNSGRHTWFKQQ